MVTKKQKDDILIFAKDAFEVGRSFSLGTDTLTPVNYADEKEKFFKSTSYNPQYIYLYNKRPNINIPLLELRHRLNRLEAPDALKVFLHEYLNDLKVHELAIRAIGTEDFPYYAQKLFDWDLQSLASIKKRLPKIHFEEQSKPKLYDAIKMRTIFTNYLEKELGIPNYVVHIDGFNDHTVRVGDKRLTIGSKVKRNANNVRRLIVHEIESHILQRYNVQQTNNPLLKLLKLYEWRLYAEGLAVYNEVLTKTITLSSYETYWLRLKAVTMLDKSFREIFNELAHEVNPDKAFLITYRVKRGMGDTSLSGGFPKDASYLYGFEKVYDYMQKGGNLRFLYSVRVPYVGELLKKYDMLYDKEFKLPKFVSEPSPIDLETFE